MPVPAAPHWRFTLSRLQRDWAHLVADQRLRSRIDSWCLSDVAVGASLDEVLLAAGHRPPTPTPTSTCSADDDERVPGDRVLAGLAALAPDDDLAARVVLQRLLPGLSATARRRSRTLDDHLVHTDDLLAAAWTVIRTRPGRPRRDFVASSLLRAVEHQVFVRPERRRLVHELVEPATMDTAVERDDVADAALFQIVGVLGCVGQQALREGDTELINALLRCDDLRDAARRLQVSERTVRYHRDAMVGRLRRALAA